MKKEFQNNNASTNESLYKSKPGSLRVKMGSSGGDKTEKLSKMFSEIDETWTPFEKSNNEYIIKYTKNASLSNLKNTGKYNDQSDEEMKEEFSKCEKELELATSSFEAYINKFNSDKKNEPSSSTESSMESIIDDLSVDSSKPTTKEVIIFLIIIIILI